VEIEKGYNEGIQRFTERGTRLPLKHLPATSTQHSQHCVKSPLSISSVSPTSKYRLLLLW